MKRLLIDAQVFHTPAWHRGMGKYSMELIKALAAYNAKAKQWDALEVILSSQLAPNQEVVAQVQQLHNVKLVKLDLARDNILDAKRVMVRNRKVLDTYVSSLDADVEFLILSPMQGGICSVFPTLAGVRKSLIFYDLIPFMFHQIYFRNQIAKNESLTKLTELLKADTYLSISETVGNDLAVVLGVDPARICNIDGGPITHSHKSAHIEVPKPFILMPTGNELRKNNHAGILGFSEFNKQHGNQYTLVVTSHFDADQVRELSQLAPNVMFTGNISGAQLNYLYEHCQALLFPSQYEGLGLPVLEAVEHNKPVACSDIAVFREMSTTAFNYFNPALSTSIARALGEAIVSTPNAADYQAIIKKYNWQRTATVAAQALASGKEPFAGDQPRVAIFTPNPESYGALGRMVQRAHGELARVCQPDYFVEGEPQGDTPRPNMLPFVTQAKNIASKTSIDLGDYRTVVYHISNSPLAAKTLFTALANPGVALLYDLDLAQAWQALGEQGLVDESRLTLERALHKKFAQPTTHLLVSLVARQKAIGVFSQHAQKTVSAMLKALGLQTPVQLLPWPTSSLPYPAIVPKKEVTIGAVDIPADTIATDVFGGVNNALFRKVVLANGHQDTTQLIKMRATAVAAATDREFDDAVSRLNLTYCVNGTSLMDAIEGLRYGTVPIRLGDQSNPAFDTPRAVVNVKDAEGVNNELSLLAANVRSYERASQKAIDDARQHHSYAAFATGLQQLIAAALGEQA